MRDIGQLMRELYGIEIYHAVISQITDGVLDEVPPGRPTAGPNLPHRLARRHRDQGASRQVGREQIRAYRAGRQSSGRERGAGSVAGRERKGKFWVSVLAELKQRGCRIATSPARMD